MQEQVQARVIDQLTCPHCGHLNERDVSGTPEAHGESGIETWAGECEGCGYAWTEIDHADRVVQGVLASASVDAIRPDLRRKAVSVVLASMESPEDPADYQPRGRL